MLTWTTDFQTEVQKQSNGKGMSFQQVVLKQLSLRDKAKQALPHTRHKIDSTWTHDLKIQEKL